MSRFAVLFWSALVLTVTDGCANSPATRFYTLSSADVVRQPVSVRTIMIDPVTVPELIDRPQIVSTEGANRVSVDEFAQWAEPLKRQIGRVLASDLTQSFPGVIVATYPQRADRTACRISVDVQSLESPSLGPATLKAIWSVRPSGREDAVRGQTVAQEMVNGSGYEAIANAYSRALAKMANDIAVAATVCAEGARP
ncbi:PqiC family protein [Paraburkholderia tropica]|uniref:PqiC family protein n=1 Tax=Paraburkholderia tropica TaxID=92647 RepID=UPI002AB7D87F|nr:PqiC family protein [Paraburkholderia tropica]